MNRAKVIADITALRGFERSAEDRRKKLNKQCGAIFDTVNKKHGFSNAVLAKKLGVTVQFLWQIRNEVRQPSSEMLGRLLELLR